MGRAVILKNGGRSFAGLLLLVCELLERGEQHTAVRRRQQSERESRGKPARAPTVVYGVSAVRMGNLASQLSCCQGESTSTREIKHVHSTVQAAPRAAFGTQVVRSEQQGHSLARDKHTRLRSAGLPQLSPSENWAQRWEELSVENAPPVNEPRQSAVPPQTAIGTSPRQRSSAHQQCEPFRLPGSGLCVSSAFSHSSSSPFALASPSRSHTSKFALTPQGATQGSDPRDRLARVDGLDRERSFGQEQRSQAPDNCAHAMAPVTLRHERQEFAAF